MAREPREAEDQSLIPLIQETEGRLKQAQEQARARAAAEVAAAERDAGLALERARGEIPLRMQRRQEEAIARIRAGIRPDAEEQGRVVRAAGQNFDRAVEAIVKAVWGGG